MMLVTILVIGAIIFCFIALLAEDFPGLFQNRGNNSSYSNNNSTRMYHNNNDYIDMNDVYCPECGSPNVTVYRDGSCECEDCQFQFHIDYLR